ncbi:hypothetical protein [Sedimentibacter sp.]|uniref:hypothetical protein n=1 Tax=Sedimentibacter sp. TaxID=1960295 RepID=UPI0028A9DA66|nr:hypothetical protein [Sedimentibacter sp.]
MEEIIINEIDYTHILEEIQINSYNLNQQFKKLNEEILVETTSQSAISVMGRLDRMQNTIDVMLLLCSIYVILQFIKLKGEFSQWH